MGQGRFLGGSSAINGLNYNRGHPHDYDNWANLTGDESWRYENLMRYFKMTENFYEEESLDGNLTKNFINCKTIDNQSILYVAHLGVGGPIPIRKGGLELKETYEAFIRAGAELGYKKYMNANAPQSEGVGPVSSTLRLGLRVSVYDAFIKPVLERDTLTVSRYSIASKVSPILLVFFFYLSGFNLCWKTKVYSIQMCPDRLMLTRIIELLDSSTPAMASRVMPKPNLK